MRQHAREVDATVGDQVEVVADAVLALALDLLDPERVRPDPGDLLEVERAPLPSARRVHAALHERAARLEHADAHLERLGLADGVVDDVDAAGVAHRAARAGPPSSGAAGRPTTPPAPRRAPAARRAAPPWPRRASPRAAPGVEARHHRDLDVGVERAEDRDRARAERARAPDEHLAAGGRRDDG